MISSKPIAALLWENWRLTRIEAGQRLALGIVLGSAALAMSGNGATVAFWILFSHCTPSSICPLRSSMAAGSWTGISPAFRSIFFTHVPSRRSRSSASPWRTTRSLAAALYLVTRGHPGVSPSASSCRCFLVALLIVAVHLAYTCIQWSTRSRVIQWIGTTVITLPTFFLLIERATSPHGIEFSLAEYASMFLIGVVSIALTVAGVARQRRGDAFATMPRPAGSAGYADWLVNLFRFPCPTSSATQGAGVV